MDIVYFTLWFLVTVALIWDTRRGWQAERASIERIEASAERIAQMTAEVLRRTEP